MVRTEHFRDLGHFSYNDDAPNPPVRQNELQISNIGVGGFLFRTRLFIEFRIAAYSQTDTQSPPTEWWENIACFVGVQYNADPAGISTSLDPIGDFNSPEWVMWEMLGGSVESMVTLPSTNERWVYVYRLAGGISESFAKRKPNGSLNASSWLAWNFIDGNSLINRTHPSFDVVYDLQVNYAVDQFYQFY